MIRKIKSGSSLLRPLLPKELTSGYTLFRVLLCCLFITAGAAAQAQLQERVISIHIPAGNLEDAIKLLERETKIPFAYEGSSFKDLQIQRQTFSNEKVSAVLTAVLAGTGMVFEARDNYIMIRKNSAGEGATGPDGLPENRTYTLSGYIEDASSGERLPGVSIYIYGTDNGTTTNNYGFYSIRLPHTKMRLRLSYLGFKTIDTTVLVATDSRLTFRMETAMNALNDVVIVAGSEIGTLQPTQMSTITITARQIESVPKFLGESDVMKTLQLMPGIQQGAEGTAALLVRGGSIDQNLILLDGSSLYNPSHLLGIFSTFNTSTIKNVDLYKGAFPARFGGRLSSVVDIVTKDGNLNGIHGDFSIGLLASQLTLEGPILKGKTSFVLSGRRTYGDLILSPIVKANIEEVDRFALYFYDLNLKVQHIFSEKDRLILSLYGGKDKFRIRNNGDFGTQRYISDMSLGWGNYNGTLRFNHLFSKNLFSNITLVLSDYKFGTNLVSSSDFDQTSIRQTTAFNSGIRDYGVKVDLDYRPHPAHSIRAGAGYTSHTFIPGVTIGELDENGRKKAIVSNNEKIPATELDAYIEEDWKLSEKFRINYGLHWSGFATEGKFYHNLQPRINVSYMLPGDWGLKGSYTRMAQYLHLLAGNSITLPTDLWVPATKSIKPQLANQFAIGVVRNLFRNKIEFSLESYYKVMDNVIEYKEGEEYTSAINKNWSDKILAGQGKAYGLELLAQKKEGRVTGWIAYTLSRTERNIPGINSNRTFPYKYDRRHDFKVTLACKITPSIEVSSCWIFQSASPFTIPAGQYEGATSYDEYGNNAPPVLYTTARNNVRIEPYHRLDVSLDFIRHKKNGVVRTWNISVFNVYNRQNPFFYYARFDSQLKSRQMMKVTLLTVLPSISYNLKF